MTQQKKNQPHKVNRRSFFKLLGGSAAATTAALTGCDPKKGNLRGGVALAAVPNDKMIYRTTPNSGDVVSVLGYGCMRWPLKPTADGTGEEIDQEAVNELVDYALAHGVNYFDTAPRYVRGLSEPATGIALSRHPRNSYFLATKLSTHPDNKELRTREGSIGLYKDSLRRLQTDYIDYYLIHAAGLGKPVNNTTPRFTDQFDTEALVATKERLLDNGILDYLTAEREAGRIRNLGWSFHGDVKVFDYLLKMQDEQRVIWDFVQIQLNYADWKNASGWNINAEYLYDELNKRGIPVVVMEPLLGGRLSNMPQYLVNRLKQRRPNESVASWAFRYAGTFPNVLTVLSGMTYMEHLQDNIRTYSPLDPLSADEVALLEQTAEDMLRYPSVPCTTCQYCMPCPYGIDIPGIFAHYNKCINDGNLPESTQSENYRKARRAFLVGYDRSVPKLRQADHCIGCDQCINHCPQSIAIPEQLTRINQYAEQLKRNTLG